MGQEEIRKGPWTEHEDVQLVFYVNLFGDRRWDFIATVSGLKRTGKSCRLRWVNYLDPGLKRGKMTAQEGRLVLELHSKWGNRWSRIARKLPGRTDNEIKNYWRTHMRKQAQERKRAAPPSSPNSNRSSSSSISSPPASSTTVGESKGRSFYDTGGLDQLLAQDTEKGYSMDDIWRDIALSENESISPLYDGCGEQGSNFSCLTMASPIWDYSPATLWNLDEEESKMFPSVSDQFFAGYGHENVYLTG